MWEIEMDLWSRHVLMEPGKLDLDHAGMTSRLRRGVTRPWGMPFIGCHSIPIPLKPQTVLPSFPPVRGSERF